MKTKVAREFIEFLREYKIISLAIAFVMGQATTTLVNSLVKDIILPILTPLFTAVPWRTAVISIGPVTIALGAFLAELINFLILAGIIFIVVKKILKYEAVK